MTVILGIDPGSNVTGYGIIRVSGNKYQYIDGGTLRLIKSKNYAELHQIFMGISGIIAEHKPDEIAIEQIFMQKNVNSALKLGQARGAAIVAASNTAAPIAEYSARQIKQAVVGYGAADKKQVQHMVKFLLRLEKIPPTDMADALAVAICHANMRGGYKTLLRNNLEQN